MDKSSESSPELTGLKQETAQSQWEDQWSLLICQIVHDWGLLALLFAILLMSGCVTTTRLSPSQTKATAPPLESCRTLPSLRDNPTPEEVLTNHLETVKVYVHCKAQVETYKRWKELP